MRNNLHNPLYYYESEPVGLPGEPWTAVVVYPENASPFPQPVHVPTLVWETMAVRHATTLQLAAGDLQSTVNIIDFVQTQAVRLNISHVA